MFSWPFSEKLWKGIRSDGAENGEVASGGFHSGKVEGDDATKEPDPCQDMAAFCAVLEWLGREANQGCSVEDRSLEYTQILLYNLCG